MEKKIKAVYCPCGAGIVMGAILPDAETNKGIAKDFMKYARRGYKIDYVSREEWREKFNLCKCYKTTKPEPQTSLAF